MTAAEFTIETPIVHWHSNVFPRPFFLLSFPPSIPSNNATPELTIGTSITDSGRNTTTTHQTQTQSHFNDDRDDDNGSNQKRNSHQGLTIKAAQEGIQVSSR